MELQRQLFDRFEPACLAIMETMQHVAFLLLVLGLILAVYKGRGLSADALLGPVLMAAVLTGFIAAWPELVGSEGWVWTATSELASQIETDAWETYIELLQDNQDTWWDWVANPRAAVTAGIVAAFGLAGQAIMYLARAFQFFMIGLILAFGPVFLALYAFSNTRAIAVRFLTGTLAVFLWDVAWRLVDLGTLNLARMPTASVFTTPAGLLLIAGWVILGYAFAPVVVSRALVAGEGIGGALLGAPVSGAGRALATVLGIKYAAAALSSNQPSSGGGSVPEMPPPPDSGPAPPPPTPASPAPANSSPQPYDVIKQTLQRQPNS